MSTATLRDHLQAIYQEHGELTPRRVVDEARDPNHPLHDRFDWDDSTAAEKYRQEQARQLIRAVKVTEPAGDFEQRTIRAFHSVPRPAGQTYVPVDEVREDEFTRTLVLRQAERDWRALYARYQHLTEFLDMVRRDVPA